jgi:hypothetical protein
VAAAALLVAAAPAAAARPGGPLARHAPVVVHDSRETDLLTSVEAFAGRVPGVPDRPPRPTVYGRRIGPWLQYWLLYPRNSQDRGVLRTGRHEGDWEMVQFRLRGGRVVQAVYAQHSGAEACGYGEVSRSRGRPVVFAARGSHASYFVPGLRDRTWPDPNDEADGRGRRVRPRLVRIGPDAPPWMRYSGRWGASRAGWVPGEMDSPRGPAFQPQGRWSNPTGWALIARPCTRRKCDERGECDGTETAFAAVLAGLGVLGAGLTGRRRLRRARLASASARAAPAEPPR